MDDFWPSLFSAVGLIGLAAWFYWSGRSDAKDDQAEANLKQKVKELETDGKNRDAVADLTDSQLDDELRNPPKPR